MRIGLDGPAELIGLGSANPLAVGSFQQKTAKTWDGRALAIIRSTGRKGIVRVEANAVGLRGDVVMLRAT